MNSIGKEILYVIDTAEKLELEKRMVPYLSTGFCALDMWTKGFSKGELITIIGRPSAGKTSLACNIARHAAVESNLSVLYVATN